MSHRCLSIFHSWQVDIMITDSTVIVHAFCLYLSLKAVFDKYLYIIYI